MDLHGVTALVRPAERAALPPFQDGDAFLAGGTALFGEEQAARRLIDLVGLRWPALEAGPGGLRIAATCTLAEAAAFPVPLHWPAAGLIRGCCEALAASFKIWNTATVGGNLCQALPAAALAAMAVALDASLLVWCPDGTERRVAAAAFITGVQRTALRPGEVLRAIDLPDAALRRRAGLRQASLTRFGRSAVLLAATGGADGIRIAVTAATPRPLLLPPERLHGVTGWLEDAHGSAAWRRHMSHRLAAELLAELA